MTLLRSLLFTAALLVITPPYALLALATFPLPPLVRYRVISGWSRTALFLARRLLGIDWKVEGHENLPACPAVILSKHQSAWETIAFQHIFPPQVYILKRELLWIPFFGWGLALMSPIAIDRSRGFAALRNIARRGRERLEQGFWVVIFPEGTRVAPGQHRPYHPGVAALYGHLDLPVVPVALNSGLFWGRRAFNKKPGRITLEFLPAIEPGLARRAFMSELETHLEGACRRLAEEA